MSADEVDALVAALDAASDRAIAKLPLEDGLPKDRKLWATTQRGVVDDALEQLKKKLTPKQIEELRAALDEQLE